tara:strand:+ start:158 stop:322 length:165 start_codon:yes stop_codon:yes gene_type:complete
MDWLKGKKTHIVAIVSIVAAWVGVWAGTVDFATAWQLTQTAVIGSTIRAGIAGQ